MPRSAQRMAVTGWVHARIAQFSNSGQNCRLRACHCGVLGYGFAKRERSDHDGRHQPRCGHDNPGRGCAAASGAAARRAERYRSNMDSRTVPNLCAGAAHRGASDAERYRLYVGNDHPPAGEPAANDRGDPPASRNSRREIDHFGGDRGAAANRQHHAAAGADQRSRDQWRALVGVAEFFTISGRGPRPARRAHPIRRKNGRGLAGGNTGIRDHPPALGNPGR